jgi:hypothetical protein
MKKICLVVVGLYINLLSCFSQSTMLTDSALYKSRKLKPEEINLVSSYYHQDGDHSAVTGGDGTQLLSDYATDIDLTLTKYNQHQHKINWYIDLSVDYYTSASSDKIDPSTISSASAHDLHIAPAVTRTVTNEQKGTAFELTGSIGTESNYFSTGFGIGFTKKSKDKSRAFTAKTTAYIDQVKLILPIELRDSATGGLPGYHFHDYPWSHRNTFSTSFTLSQIISTRWQLLFAMDIAYQQGYLSTPYHRIYFDTDSETVEHLPSERFKIPVSVRSSYFLRDKFIIRSFYRFYHDDWGLNAHTFDNEFVCKITPFFSVSPFYRYYIQNAIRYFAPDKAHLPTDIYYSSNYDLSAFHSSFFGTGFRIAPINGILGHKHWTMLELRYGHYIRSNDFHSDVLSMNLRFNP